MPAGKVGSGVGPGIEIPPGRLTAGGGGRFETGAGDAPREMGAGDVPPTGAGLIPEVRGEYAEDDDVLRAGKLARLTDGSETLMLGRPGTLAKLTGGSMPETRNKTRENEIIINEMMM